MAQPPLQAVTATQQVTADPFKDPKSYTLQKIGTRASFYPFYTSAVALTTQALNPYFAQNNLSYGGGIINHFRFLIDRVKENGLLSVYRGFIPYLLASYELQIADSIFIYLQKKGKMPVNINKLKKPPRRKRKKQNPNQTEEQKKQAEIDFKEANRLREEAKSTKPTPKSIIRYFFYDFGTRALLSTFSVP